MKGISHLVTGVATVPIIDTGLKYLSKILGSDVFKIYRDFIFATPGDSDLIKKLSPVVFIAMFVLGCLLPDIDQENSTLGRYIHIPVAHRTWTHTAWGLIFLGIASIFAPYIFWLAYGCFLHIFYDSLSKGGICWFYPISQYRTWASGAQVKKGHSIYLYRTGEASETVLATLVVILGVAAFALGFLV